MDSGDEEEENQEEPEVRGAILFISRCACQSHSLPKYPLKFCCLSLLNFNTFFHCSVVGENQIYQRQKRCQNCQTGYVLLLI